MPSGSLTPSPAFTALLKSIREVMAEYKDQPVTVDLEARHVPGTVVVEGYFGQEWTHGGYCDVKRKRVSAKQLKNVTPVLVAE